MVVVAGCDVVFGLHDVAPGAGGGLRDYTCPDSYTSDATGHHRAVTGASSWAQARIACVDDQGSDGTTGFTHLAVFEADNPDEGTEVWNEVQQLATQGSGRTIAFWVGSWSQGSDAPYAWVNGEDPPVSGEYPWRDATEPTALGLCALVNFDAPGMQVYDCGLQTAFACECDGLPDPLL